MLPSKFKFLWKPFTFQFSQSSWSMNEFSTIPNSTLSFHLISLFFQKYYSSSSSNSQTVLSATRISGLAIFISIFSCLFAGALVSKYKRIKWIIIVSQTNQKPLPFFFSLSLFNIQNQDLEFFIHIFLNCFCFFKKKKKPFFFLWVAFKAGAACDTLGLGLMIRYRNSSNTLFELVLPQLFRGLAEGLVGFPVQALIQVSCFLNHHHQSSL